MSKQTIQKLLQEIKDTEVSTNIAMVTNVSWQHDPWDKRHVCKVIAYDPVIKTNITLEGFDTRNMGGDSLEYKLITTCAIGDIIQYKHGEIDTKITAIVRNFSHEHRLNTFKSAYDMVYVRTK